MAAPHGEDTAMKTEAQKKAEMKYRCEKVRQVVGTFSPKDADLYEWLCAQPSKAGAIKRLLREELSQQRGE